MEHPMTNNAVRIRPTPARTQTRRGLSPVLSGARQKGVVLFIALIVLVAMTLAGLALVRSVDTSNIIAGNLAFKQSTTQAADVGIEVAVSALPTIIATTLDSVVTSVAPGASYLYYPTRRVDDAKGVPTTTEYTASAGAGTAINWSSVPIASTVAGNEVKIVIDRLCRGPAPVTDLEGQCFSEPGLGGGSKKAGAVVFSGTTTVYYRVTARVSGPRNTVSIVQAVLSR